MSVGVCYFPEHWPRERWERDVEQMADAGIEYVRMAEFSWSRIEPEPGQLDFSWLEDAVSLIGDHGMEAVLCTPTATPPKWLVDQRLSILQEEPDGTTRHYGSRRHYCFNSPVYREETRRIVSAMADHFADNPHVAGWQTDNEYGCHETIRCWCDDCATAFREWLRERYGDVESLNEAWGTSFWSQTVRSFEEVDPPRHTAAEHHPSRLLDYYRFSADSAVDYNAIHAELLREANDDWFVAHNFMGDFDSCDAFRFADDLDLITWDSYPTGFAQDRRQGAASADELRAGDPDQVGMNHDLYRGTKQQPFWVMEQQPGDVNWPPYAPQPGEGAMRLWAHHAVAHGADSVLYFRWRRCREGQEQYHAGLRKQDGSPDRGYHDADRAATELAQLDLDPVDADVAVLHEYDNLWATSIQPHAPDWEYWTHMRQYYAALRARSVQADVVHPDRDLSGYDAVVAPALHLVGDGLAAKLEGAVEDGTELLLTARSGAKDRANKLPDAPAPGPLTDLVGATVDQHESVPEQLDRRVTYDGDTYEFRTFAEWLDAADATTVGSHVGGVGDGHAAITEHEFGAGHAAYCGVWPEADLADAVVTDLLDRAGVAHSERFPTGVRATQRDGYTWVTNFTSDPVSVTLPDDARPVVGDDTVDAFGTTVYEGEAAAVSIEER